MLNVINQRPTAIQTLLHNSTIDLPAVRKAKVRLMRTPPFTPEELAEDPERAKPVHLNAEQVDNLFAKLESFGLGNKINKSFSKAEPTSEEEMVIMSNTLMKTFDTRVQSFFGPQHYETIKAALDQSPIEGDTSDDMLDASEVASAKRARTESSS